MSDQNERSIKAYISDMIALERHSLEPIERQLDDKDHQKYPEAASLIARIRRVLDTHVEALEDRLETLGGHAASPMKTAAGVVLGQAAKAIDAVRKTEVSKDLRDDYTALSLASISYTMLHTTALAMHDAETAQLAKAHLEDIAPLIMDLSRTMPRVVVQELRDTGLSVDESAAAPATANTQEAWKQ